MHERASLLPLAGWPLGVLDLHAKTLWGRQLRTQQHGLPRKGTAQMKGERFAMATQVGVLRRPTLFGERAGKRRWRLNLRYRIYVSALLREHR